jgi:AcrR family transcriptional regulator
MRSAPDPPVDARDRLIAAAIDLIGREGVRAATVRRVAEAAGVSGPLVLHHFGSKEGLVTACDETVAAVLGDAMATLTSSGRDGALARLMQIEGTVAALAYIGRSLQDGGSAGSDWFDLMIRMTTSGLADMESTGEVRPTDDPMMRALLLSSMDLGFVLLRPHIERALGAPITDPSVVERWMRTEFDLLSRGLFDTADTPVEDLR